MRPARKSAPPGRRLGRNPRRPTACVAPSDAPPPLGSDDGHHRRRPFLTQSPRGAHPQPPQPEQTQAPPGRSGDMAPVPDHGERSYKGSGRLAEKAAIITGADSGIGRAVAIAFAREGADVLASYLDEHEDARQDRKSVV